MSNGKSYQINPDLLKGISRVAAVRKVNPDVIKKIIESIEHPQWHLHAAGLAEALNFASQYSARVLLAFTARSVCGYCTWLEQEVFSKPDFGWWVWHNNLVLANIDFDCFPWRPDCHPPAEDKTEYTNYNIGNSGFPTVIILNSQGTECGRYSGYTPGSGVAAYTNKLEEAARFHVAGSPCNV